jgi:hypothetical protein
MEGSVMEEDGKHKENESERDGDENTRRESHEYLLRLLPKRVHKEG